MPLVNITDIESELCLSLTLHIVLDKKPIIIHLSTFTLQIITSTDSEIHGVQKSQCLSHKSYAKHKHISFIYLHQHYQYTYSRIFY